MLKTHFVYGNNDALLEISSAQYFGACTNVSCLSIRCDKDVTHCVYDILPGTLVLSRYCLMLLFII